MTIYSLDIETYEQRKDGLYYPVLDTTKFTIGAIKSEKNKKTEFYYNKEDMWKRLKEIAKRAYNRKKVAYVYAHFMKYDFYGIADFKDKELKIQSHEPFIATLNHNGKESLKLLDSMNIWGKSLKEVGKMMNYEKLEMPKYIGSPDDLRRYLERDVEVCLKSIIHAKEITKEAGIKTRRLYTIGQIAICSTLKDFKDENITSEEFRESFFADQNSNTVWKSHHPEKVRSAYRGAIEHAKPGKWEEADYYDFNGLYQWAAQNMRFPNLKSEKLTIRPLEKKKKEEIIGMIGISRCIVKNNTCKHGLLQIRTPKSTYIPREEKYLIGTWTHEELETAEKEGYEIMDMEWSITYEETENPYRKIIPKLNKRKEEAKTEIERDFWKGIANHGFGKWGQIRMGREIIIDTIEETKKYKERNYKMTHGIPGTYLMVYRKENDGNEETKSYYAPIIPTLINAKARCEMHKNIKKLKYENWLYTGNDSIITTDKELREKLEIGKETGKFKIIAERKPIEIIAKKHYKIGEQVKAAGIRTSEIKEGDFERRVLKNKKMVTLMNTGDTRQVGKFITEERDLREVKNKYEETEKMLEEERIYIDSDIDNITFYTENKELWKAIS